MPKNQNWERLARIKRRGEELLRANRPVRSEPGRLHLRDFGSKQARSNTITSRVKRSSMNRKVKVTLAERA